MVRKIVTILMVLSLLLLFNACGNAGQANGSQVHSTSTVQGTPLAEVPLQLLQRSQKATQSLKSVHFDLLSATILSQLSSNAGGAALLPALQPLPGGNPMVLQGSGDEIVPGQQQFHLAQVGPGSPSFRAMEIMQKDQVYFQARSGKWYIISKPALLAQSHTLMFTNTGLVQVTRLVDLALTKGQLTDYGYEWIAGHKLRHIAANLDSSPWQSLFIADAQNMSAYQSMQDKVSHISGKVEFWLDENTSYIHRLILTFNYDAAYYTDQGALFGHFHLDQRLTMGFNKFDQPITITSPTQATPIDNVDKLGLL